MQTANTHNSTLLLILATAVLTAAICSVAMFAVMLVKMMILPALLHLVDNVRFF